MNPTNNTVVLRAGTVCGVPSEVELMPTEKLSDQAEVSQPLKDLIECTADRLDEQQGLMVKQLLVEFADIFASSDDDM